MGNKHLEDGTVVLEDGRRFTAQEWAEKWEKLRAVFPQDQVEKLPRPISRDNKDRYNCDPNHPNGKRASADGHYCGGYHARSIHLDYIGHATITERLNSVDEAWELNFKVENDHGAPMLEGEGTWFTLTILGVTKLCVGDPGRKGIKDADGRKEMLGDALRNGAMRFGVGTYLWSKSEEAERRKLGALEDQEPQQNPQQPPQGGNRQDVDDTVKRIRAEIEDATAKGPDELKNLLGYAQQNGYPEGAISEMQKRLSLFN